MQSFGIGNVEIGEDELQNRTPRCESLQECEPKTPNPERYGNPHIAAVVATTIKRYYTILDTILSYTMLYTKLYYTIHHTIMLYTQLYNTINYTVLCYKGLGLEV